MRPARAGGRPIRVGFVMHVMQVAGAEVLVEEIIRTLAHEIEPTVICLDAVGTIGERLLGRGVVVRCLHRRPGRDLGVALRLAAVAREREIEVLHAHQYTPFFYAALARAWLLGRGAPRVILTEHGRHFPDVVSPLRRFVNRLVLDRLASDVNAVCRFSARALSRNDGFRGGRIDVIENGIDVDRYGPPPDLASHRTALGLDPSRRYVATVARFHPIKDHASLLRGFANAARAVPDVDLLLAGDGPLRADMEGLARSLGIESRVRFLGVRRDVPAILAAADVFALTSICEAASLTLLEAMATGLPVVVTDVGGNPEIVERGRTGLLVPRGDAQAIGEALVELLRDSSGMRTLGARGRALALLRYRLESTVRAHARRYMRVCSRARGQAGFE